MKIKTDWEKEFEQKFCFENEDGNMEFLTDWTYYNGGLFVEAVEDFIRSLLQQERKRVVEEIGKMKKSEGNTTLANPTFPYAQRDYFNAYNQAIDDILSKFSNQEERKEK